MERGSDYIAILCGQFEDDYHPLTRAEFWKLYHRYGDSIDGVVSSGENRVTELMQRSASFSFALENMRQMGIRMVTFMDNEFPDRLYSKLRDFCPPLLYSCGEASIKRGKFAGYVGSRTIGEEDVRWTENAVEKNRQDGYGVVTGGAKGVDSIAMNYALNNGSTAIVYLPDTIKSKIKEPFIQQNILDGKLLIYSHISPYAKKNRNSFVAAAMERNKFI